MASPEENNFYLELTKNTIRFEPVSKVTNVFFDDSNRQVFAIRSGGVTGVVVKGPDEKLNANFRMSDRGDVVSVKFSPNMTVLALQRSQQSVEFANFNGELDRVEYSQTCKGKNTKLIGFIWTTVNEVVFVTDHGMELYQVIPEKKNLRLIKAYSVTVNWFVWLPIGSVLLLSTGTLGNVLQPFQFKPGTMLKLAKFEVDISAIPKPPKLCLLERDVTLATIYGQLYVVVLRHHAMTTVGSIGAEIALYLLDGETPARKLHVLRLDMSGRFAINIVDSLVVVHHQASKTSMLFDIKLAGVSDGFCYSHHPVLCPLPLKPFHLKVHSVPSTGAPQIHDLNCELYSPNWIVFQPNIVIDAKLGCLWLVGLRLQPLTAMLPDKGQLIDFLLMRRDSKAVILMVCKEMLSPSNQANLSMIAAIFNKLNKVYWKYLQEEVQALANETDQLDIQKPTQPIIDQSDMYTHVFSMFADNMDIKYTFIVAVLIEYIRSLNQFFIPIHHYLYELIINTLVQHDCFYQLHQFLQYHVISDSKPLACLMLSLESVYSPAYQLALDMLKRLSTANEEIVEVLLSKQQLLSALRFVRGVGTVDQVSARKFLEAAWTTDDQMLFYTVFKFFEQRNIRLRGTPKFPQGEHCSQYVRHFEALFGKNSHKDVSTLS